MSFYEAGVRPVEILSCVPAKVCGIPAVAMTVRANPCNSFGSTDVAISRAQAIRLRDDLNSLLESEQPIWSESD